MPGWESVAPDVARRRGVPASVWPVIRAVPQHPRGPHDVWRWEWSEVEFVPVDKSIYRGGQRRSRLEAIGETMLGWDRPVACSPCTMASALRPEVPTS